MIRVIINFFKNLKNACSWFSFFLFGFNNKEWDYYYFFQVLRFKLSKMERYFRKNGIALIHHSQARICQLAIRYIDVITSDEEGFPIFKKYYEKYPPEPFDKKKDLEEMTRDFTEYCKTYRFKVYCRVANIVNKKKESYKNKLFYLLDKYIYYLWD